MKVRKSKSPTQKRGLAIIIILIIIVAILALSAPILGLMIVGTFALGGIDKSSTGGVFAAGGGTYTGVYPTVYCPCVDRIEGGKKDDNGKPIRTLQQYLSNSAEYVSVAMDINIRSDKPGRNGPYSYGTRIRIPEMEDKYNNGNYIEFRLVDNGGSFNGTDEHPMDNQIKPRGFTAIDIAVDARPGSTKPDEAALNWRSDPVTLIFEGATVSGSSAAFSCLNSDYAFPIVSNKPASYGKVHHHYSATDMFVYDKRVATAGHKIVSSVNGTVTAIGSRGDGGHSVLIAGSDGYTYYYAHLIAGSIPSNVRRGARVRAGQEIGKLGDTGNAVGNPHLHFGISKPEFRQSKGWYPSQVRDPRPNKGPNQVSNWKVLDSWKAGKCIDPKS